MMKIENVPFAATKWENVPAEEHKGERGTSFWRVRECGNMRVRMVDYSAGFQADHWCCRGHVLLVLEGKLVVELKDGREFPLGRGMSIQVGDDKANPHLVRTAVAARVFIVD
jgi:quercetin dioxygenase-like cupin family protein